MAPCTGTCATGSKCRNTGLGDATRCKVHVRQTSCAVPACDNGGNKEFEGFCFKHLSDQTSYGNKARKTEVLTSKRTKSDVQEEDHMMLEEALLDNQRVQHTLREAEAINESLRRECVEKGVLTSEMSTRLAETENKVAGLQANLHETQRLLQEAESRAGQSSSAEYNPVAVRAILKASATEKHGLNMTVNRLKKEMSTLKRLSRESENVKKEAVQNFKFANLSQQDQDDIIANIRIEDDETPEENYQKTLRELERLSVRQ